MAGPPAVVARARTAVRLALTARLAELADRSDTGDLAPRALVGVSGGADSLALLATTVWVGRRMGLEVEAAVLDHGLQEGSDRVAERAATACERLGAGSVHVRRLQVDPDAPGGIESAARDVRHRALEELREHRRALAILLGHQLDDQAEQVLMGLARGAGPRVLAGIPARRGPLLRPFLGVGGDERTALRRADTEEICRLHDVDPWQDPMNTDPATLRARVRHRALPVLREALGEQIDGNLARTAALLRPDADHLDELAVEAIEQLRRADADPSTLLALDAHALAATPAPVRTRVLRDACRRAVTEAGQSPGKSLQRRHVLEADALIVTWHGQGAVPLPGRIEVARRDGLLVWRRAERTA